MKEESWLNVGQDSCQHSVIVSSRLTSASVSKAKRIGRGKGPLGFGPIIYREAVFSGLSIKYINLETSIIMEKNTPLRTALLKKEQSIGFWLT